MVIPIVEAGFIRGDGTFGSSSETFACGDVDMAYSICYDGNFEEYIRRMQDDADRLYEDIIFFVFAAVLFTSGILSIRKKKTK